MTGTLFFSMSTSRAIPPLSRRHSQRLRRNCAITMLRRCSLVRAYCNGLPDDSLQAEWLRELQRRWWTIVQRKPLAWYAEQKVKNGTFAALVGLPLNWESQSWQHGTWTASAIGDSCLFQIRGS